jgi:hypothetical protein
MAVIVFEPNSTLTGCVNITIVRDFTVEEDETFTFRIPVIQDDPAIIVGSPNSFDITILDEADGKSL